MIYARCLLMFGTGCSCRMVRIRQDEHSSTSSRSISSSASSAFGHWASVAVDGFNGEFIHFDVIVMRSIVQLITIFSKPLRVCTSRCIQFRNLEHVT